MRRQHRVVSPKMAAGRSAASLRTAEGAVADLPGGARRRVTRTRRRLTIGRDRSRGRARAAAKGEQVLAASIGVWSGRLRTRARVDRRRRSRRRCACAPLHALVIGGARKDVATDARGIAACEGAALGIVFDGAHAIRIGRAACAGEDRNGSDEPRSADSEPHDRNIVQPGSVA
jgi:hypothetical protein